MLLSCCGFIKYMCHNHINSIWNAACLYCGFYKQFLCKYFYVSVCKTSHAQWISFTIPDGLHLWSYTSRQKHQLLVHSKLLCGSVSNPGNMRHGHRLMGRQRHIPYSIQNLLLRSVRSCYHFCLPKDHHCLPETLLPKRLVSKDSVSFIWIYTYIQLQTNMWDAFQGCDSITQNYVAFTWISSCNNVNKWGWIASQETNSTVLLLYCECVMQGS